MACACACGGVELWTRCGKALQRVGARGGGPQSGATQDRLTPEIFFAKAHKGPCQREKAQA